VNRFVEDIFIEEYVPTKEKVFQIKNINDHVQIKIADTNPPSKYRNVVSTKFRRIQGVIVVYDVTNEETFENAKDWYMEAKRFTSGVPIILIGNKQDKEEKVVDYQTAKEFADNANIEFFETSCKHNTNVEESFYELLSQISDEPIFRNETPQIQPKDSKCICF